MSDLFKQLLALLWDTTFVAFIMVAFMLVMCGWGCMCSGVLGDPREGTPYASDR